ncbi:MAG: autotransporter outer membrane beta-barrel domain-containing protein [Rhodanobacter sp.]
MSILKKTTMALALAAAVGFSATSMAYTVSGTPALPLKIANVSVTGNTVTYGVTQALTYSIDPPDNIIGRTTGISVRLTLQNGATFNTAPTAGVGAAAPGWTASVTAGGLTGDNYIVVSVSPPSTPTSLTTGPLLTINMVDITASTLATVGNSVSGKFDIFDPVGGGTFNTQTLPIVTSANVLASTVAGGETASRIDVGTNVTYPNSKTAFSSTGVISGADKVTFDAGTLTQAVAAGVTYSYNTADAFTTVVSMSNLGNFDGTKGSVSLATDATCATPITGSVVAYNAGANTATITYPEGSLVGASVTGGSAELCFTVSGADLVSDSTVSTSSSFVANVSGIKSNDSAANALPLKYNGSVVKVEMYNPGGNTVQQSVLRVSNTSGLGGKVTITGTDDAGNASTPVTFQLAAGNSRQLNADALQAGTATGLTGALGTPVGKWRLVVTGEFNGLVVQSLMRNNNTGTFTNMSHDLQP